MFLLSILLSHQVVSEQARFVCLKLMTIPEGARSRTIQGEMEGVTNMLQEVLRRLDTFDSRLVTLEKGAVM